MYRCSMDERCIVFSGMVKQNSLITPAVPPIIILQVICELN